MKRSLIVFALAAGGCAPGAVKPPTASVSERALPTGRILDPVGRVIDVGNMPLGISIGPDNRHAAVLLSGFRERGLQTIDLNTGTVTTYPQRGAFLGVAFSPDGKSIYASGGGRDVVYRYAWDGIRASLADSIIDAPVDSTKPRFVSAIAFSRDGRKLYVAENLADSIATIDVASSRVTQRVPTGHYPYAIVVAPNEDVFVSSWGESGVDVYRGGALAKKIEVGRHPSAMVLDRAGARLYVVSSSTDKVSVVDVGAGKTIATLNDAAPSGPSEGSTPDGIALSPDESKLFVAEADNNSIAVFDLKAGGAQPVGRIPVLWYPAALAVAGDSLVVVNGKGRRAGPNPANPKNERAGTTDQRQYVLGQLNGALSILPMNQSSADLARFSTRVSRANGWDIAQAKPNHPPFEHVVLIIKENRTYDQVFGDDPSGDGDSTLLWYRPNDTSPNHRALAHRFGLYDRFFTNAEVSSQGHPWSTSAYVTEYTEKTVQELYRGVRPDRGDEGEVDTPITGYIWDEAKRKGITLRNYGEYTDPNPTTDGSPPKYHATRPGLVEFTNPDYPTFDMTISDQHRVDIWLAEFNKYVKASNLPTFEIVWLPRDHTAGASPGQCTPLACFADNDLGLGRIIDALSHSPYWKNTAVFVFEDDSQAGPDHFDSHRSVAFTISAYNKPGLIHRFVNTTDMLATIEEILHLDPLSQFDRYGHPLHDIWRDKPDLTPYTAIVPAHSLTEVNGPRAVGASESRHFDLAHADRVDDARFNRLLWKVIKGEHLPYPGSHRSSTLDFVRDR